VDNQQLSWHDDVRNSLLQTLRLVRGLADPRQDSQLKCGSRFVAKLESQPVVYLTLVRGEFCPLCELFLPYLRHYELNVFPMYFAL
jgi:hypothetical protein